MVISLVGEDPSVRLDLKDLGVVDEGLENDRLHSIRSKGRDILAEELLDRLDLIVLKHLASLPLHEQSQQLLFLHLLHLFVVVFKLVFNLVIDDLLNDVLQCDQPNLL